MKLTKRHLFCSVVVVLCGCGVEPASTDALDRSAQAVRGRANGNGSSKAGMVYQHVAILDAETLGWTRVAQTEPTRPPGGGTLTMTAFVKCGLYTDTEVRSRGGKKERAQASAEVAMRVRVEGDDGSSAVLSSAYPDCQRTQTLEASFAGLLENLEGEECVAWDAEANGWIFQDVAGCEESVRLAQSTWNTASWPFEFVAQAGVKYVFSVEAQIGTGTETTSGGAASAKGSVGEAALTWYQQ